jgi:protein-S-isoprenylcysteine O-methyltransferase Ste14
VGFHASVVSVTKDAMVYRLPPHIAAFCLTIYWGWVIIKLVKLARKIGKDPNAMPRERVGQWMRVLWYPCILVLLAGLWIAAARQFHGGGGLTGWLVAPGMAWLIVALAATLICIICTIITFVCWQKMGRSWRIGIDPGERLELVSTGPYRHVRHPIYALRMVINVCACVMAPTVLVIVPAVADIVLLQIEARREERYMETVHGEVYARYKNSVGRFVPRTFVV